MSAEHEKKYRAAIIGCGGIGFFYDRGGERETGLSHFSAIESHEAFKLVAVTDTDSDITAMIAKQYNKRAYNSFHEMMRLESPLDLVVVATPDETHADILKSLPDYSPGIVFSEKPLAQNESDTQGIIELYGRSSTALQVNFTRRFLDEFRELGKTLSTGAIGTIDTVTVCYSRGFHHNCSHFIDLLQWYFGMPSRASILSVKKGISDNDPSLSMFLQYDNGPDVHLIARKADRLMNYELDISGSGGRIRVLQTGAIEFYTTATHSILDNFLEYRMGEKKKIDFNRAIPAALDNIKEWLDNEVELLSPGVNSITTHSILAMAKEEKGRCQNWR